MTRPRLFECLLLGACLGCGSGGPTAETAGSTTAAEGTESETTETAGETGDELFEQLCDTSIITINLTGSASPPGDCDSFSFSGSLVEQLDANSWHLDSCGCNEDCEAADPYELEILFDSPTLAIPPVPWCLEIDVNRNEQCFVTSVVVREIGVGTRWAAGSWDALIPGFEWLSSQIVASTTCSDGDDDGGVTTGHRIRVLDQLDLDAQESGVVTGPGGTVEIRNGGAWSNTELAPGEVYLDYFVIPR